MQRDSLVAEWITGLLGALVGATVGVTILWLLVKSGLYAIVAPGALTGIGGGWLLKSRNWQMGVLCMLIGAVATIVGEWIIAPFIADRSFSYFVTHLHQLKSSTFVLGGIGVLMAYWFGMGRDRRIST